MNISIIAQLKTKKKTPGTAIIYVRGYINRKAVAAKSTGIKIDPAHWDPDKRCMLPTAPNARLINQKLAMNLQDVQAILLKKEIMGASINRQHIKEAVKGNNGAIDFYGYCMQKIATYSNKETRRHYTSEVTKLQQFAPTLQFSDIDYSFLNGYKTYMQARLGNKPNTIWKSFKFINTVIIDAIKKGGILQQNPFSEFNRGNYVQTQRQYLTIDHCNAIEELTTASNETMRTVAIYFLLMAYSGMRWAEAKKFNYQLHVVNDERIIMSYQKKDTGVNNKMHQRLKHVAKLTIGRPLAITNQEFNRWLKVIASSCNIPVNLTCHVGRHTLGGLLAKMKVPIESAQKILGHRSIKSTWIYYHQNQETIDGEMDKLNVM